MMNDILFSKTSNCKSCFKCLRECVVKSIEYKNDLAKIVQGECILCGKCVEVCHQKAKVYRNDVSKILNLLENNNKVIASVAPSFASNFDASTFEYFKEKLIKIGFFDAEETIIGAEIVNKEYEEIIKKSTDQNIFIISSCPTTVKYITNYHPDLKEYLLPVVSPMVAHTRLIKSKIPDAKVVFIGPCISKKDEITWENETDYAITFEELDELFKIKNTVIKYSSSVTEAEIKDNLILYPTDGGVLNSMKQNNDYNYISATRIKKIKNILDNLSIVKNEKLVLELNSCEGSCLGGPGNISKDYITNKVRLTKYFQNNTFTNPYTKKVNLHRTYNMEKKIKPVPTDDEIRNILKLIGKPTEKYELNCGSCGYESCRQKAIAVYYNKADLNMCIPFLKERAEGLTSKVIDNVPMGLICLNENLEIIDINKKAKAIFDISPYCDTKFLDISTLMDISDIIICQSESKNIHNKVIKLDNLDIFIELSIIINLEENFIFLVTKDITKETLLEKENTKHKRETIEIADKVIKKQMLVVQEIASLLGETTAETKIALTKLKKSVDLNE